MIYEVSVECIKDFIFGGCDCSCNRASYGICCGLWLKNHHIGEVKDIVTCSKICVENGWEFDKCESS